MHEQIKEQQTEPPKALRRSMHRSLRGGLAAAFTAAVIGGGGAAYYHMKPPTPYSQPYAAEAYHIPARACADALTSDTALPPAPRGNGQPVMLIPGFLGNDAAMGKLAAHLKAHGYRVYGWGQGFNTGMTEAKAGALALQLKDITAKHSGHKVALIGFSLGGVYARELARDNPQMVSQVITMGSPFAMTDKNGNLDKRIQSVAQAFNPTAEDPSDTRTPLPVPTTSLYSTNDFMVMWKGSLNSKQKTAENIPVAPGHLGMTSDRKTADIILHRLAETPQGWQPLAPRLCTASMAG